MDVSLSMTRQVLLALRFLHHDMHLVHGDLKPDNVLLKRNDDEGKFTAKVMATPLSEPPSLNLFALFIHRSQRAENLPPCALMLSAVGRLWALSCHA